MSRMSPLPRVENSSLFWMTTGPGELDHALLLELLQFPRAEAQEAAIDGMVVLAHLGGGALHARLGVGKLQGYPGVGHGLRVAWDGDLHEEPPGLYVGVPDHIRHGVHPAAGDAGLPQ